MGIDWDYFKTTLVFKSSNASPLISSNTNYKSPANLEHLEEIDDELMLKVGNDFGEDSDDVSLDDSQLLLLSFPQSRDDSLVKCIHCNQLFQQTLQSEIIRSHEVKIKLKETFRCRCCCEGCLESECWKCCSFWTIPENIQIRIFQVFLLYF